MLRNCLDDLQPESSGSEESFYERIQLASSEFPHLQIPETRLEIQQQTIQCTKEFQYYCLEKGEIIQFNQEEIIKSIRKNEMLHDLDISIGGNHYNTKIYVDHRDCVDCTIEFLANHPEFQNQVMLLNLANPLKPGGGWQSGAKAQEEQLFRRSNYWQHIATSEYDPERIWSYPIPQFGGIFSPNVIFFRHSEENSLELGGPYAFMASPHRINCLAVAACQWPHLIDDISRHEQVLHPDYEIITRKKIETIFSIASRKHQKVLILGAFGCGAFQNPPQHIARLFQEVISESFSNTFHTIIFSVYTVGAAAIQYNYDSFVDIFGDINGNGKGCLIQQHQVVELNDQDSSMSESKYGNRCNVQ